MINTGEDVTKNPDYGHGSSNQIPMMGGEGIKKNFYAVSVINH